MARVISSSLLCSTGRWLSVENTHCYGRKVYFLGMTGHRKHSELRVRNVCHWRLFEGRWGGSRESTDFISLREKATCLGVHAARQHEIANVRCSMNGSADPEGVRYLTTNVTVQLTQQVRKADVSELVLPFQTSSMSTITEQKHEVSESIVLEAGEYGEGNSATKESMLVATLDVNVVGGTQGTVMSVTHPIDERWWHIPDSIDEMLRLPSDFEERVEALFRSFGSRIESRELLLRVLVHKSYYDLNMPAAMREQQYLKPHPPLLLDCGDVRQLCVEDGPSKISCMIFGDAHAEVRSQLAILGDGIIGLAVSSVLVRQHSSAGTITERKCQLVSNSNLSRVWSCLIGSQIVVLSSSDSSSQAAAQRNMMADSCEAYIGALYTEKGFDIAYRCVMSALLPLLVQADSVRNPVHALNVQSLTSFHVLPEYRLIGIDNKDTQYQVCRVRVYVKGIRMATGMGMNKKLARIDGAQKALEKWSTVFEEKH